MPQSLANVVVHMIFSTKGRTPVLTKEIREELFLYMAATSNNHGCSTLQLGGVEDHVHILVRITRNLSVAQLLEKVKTSSSKWMKERWQIEFAWQGGYAAFSVGVREVPKMRTYVANQEEHHRKVSLQDELRQILREEGVEFDERYLWD